MARPKKEGLEYFPLDVDMDQDDKIALIEAKHGLVGFSVIVKLLMKIYKNGYYYEWGEKEQLLFSRRVGVDYTIMTNILDDCINWDLFDKKLYEEQEILTSKGVQERYIEATARRKEVVVIKEYLLIKPSHHIGNSKIRIKLVDINRDVIDPDINPNNAQLRADKPPKKPVAPKKEEPPKGDNVIDLLLANKIITEDKVNHTLREDLDDVFEAFGFDNPLEMVQEAIKDAARGNGRTWKFIYKKLNGWRKEGYKNPRDIALPTAPKQENSIDALKRFADKRGVE
ncbi:hypothetical protein A374_08919 [Fictibacillus macauensis ZFHKF-1]|uniref:DnaD domain-containing protein n=1 Tax=Fictibacillus macauensis ZFHKF-1 TaxID=1196324 RepID=I8UGE9_9BACL|nr:Lin1244/Lin1753 domain-containing protein [Fictibacillus macauensis]EIT85945.1 hypothetical protein A374_08919 [Fictibacillus macauensis ZFHKF-1]